MCQSELKYCKIMRNSKDKKQTRHDIVKYAKSNGIKAAARQFHTVSNTVRRWVRRFIEFGYNGLEGFSTRPKTSPMAIDEEKKDYITGLKDKYKRMGADQVKVLETLDVSAKTIRKIWREKGKSSRKRRKKHETKRNLREIKKKLGFLQQVCEDTKELKDIPEYYPSLLLRNTPKFQYSFRDVTTGMLFMGFANEKSLAHTTLFAEYLQFHLNKLSVNLANTIRQTDNGSEYIGSWNAVEESSYTKMVESIIGQKHHTIPPRRHRYQADVETVHDIIEREFYEIESFTSRSDFMAKAYAYQLFFNMVRPNTYKEDKNPWQLAKEKVPNLNINVPMIPPVDLDLLLNFNIALINKGVPNVPSGPFYL